MKHRWILLGGIAALLIGGAAFWAGRSVPPLTTNAAPVEGPDAPTGSVPSEEEYRAVFGQYVACAADVGMVPAGPVAQDRFGRLGVVLKSSDASAVTKAASIHEHLQVCRAELDRIELAWSLSHRPTDDEAIAARNHAAACLSASGFSIGLEPSREDLHDLVVGVLRKNAVDDENAAEVSAVATCMEATADAFNWPAYGGS